MNESSRPTKKQRELLSFIDGFIKGNGYGPSYREVMRALEYKSVSTVATHIDGLIARGYLRKKDNSARSLEVNIAEVRPSAQTASTETDTVRAHFHRRIEALQSDSDADNQHDIVLLRQAADLLGIEL